MNPATNLSPTTEERFWAALSHLSSLAFGMGILLPIIGWSEQRRKSRYTAFQCLQALGYQSLGYTVWFLALLVAVVGMAIVIILQGFQGEKNGQVFHPFSGPTITWMWIVLLGFLSVYLLLPIVAAVSCGLGKDFRYPLLGDRLATYLRYHPTDTEPSNSEVPWLLEEHEDRWVAAMGHFSVLIALWGLLAPVSAWIVQGARNSFLKFQSMQTTIYQIFVNVVFLAGGFVYLSGALAFLALTRLNGDLSQSAPAEMTGLFVFLLFMLCASLILLIVPLFHILGQWAGYRVLKGENYRYPIIGRLVEKKMAKS